MSVKLTWLELIYLIVGLGIVIHGVIDHGLTAIELGAAMFFIGLVPVTRADKKHAEGESKTVRDYLLALLGGKPS